MCCGSHNSAGDYELQAYTPAIAEYNGRSYVASQQPPVITAERPSEFPSEINGPLDPHELASMTEAVTNDERCRCPGDSRAGGYYGCLCLRKMDGEDMRCPICRAYCPPEWTPRMMSTHAREAMERAKSGA